MTDTITIMCLVHRDGPERAFPVRIAKKLLVGDLKELIKEERPNFFCNVDAVDLDLWKVNIPCDNADALARLILNDNEILKPPWDITDYFPKQPAKKHIHVIVKHLPASNGKTFLSC